MLTLQKYNSSSDKIFLLVIFEIGFEIGVILSNYVEECTVLKYLGYGYYEVKVNSTGKIVRVYKDALYSDHEEGIKAYNKKVSRAMSHLKKLNNLKLDKLIIKL